MLQQLTASGFTGRHQPRSGTGEVDEETGEEQLDPRYAPAQDALERGDVAGAVAEYQKLVDANPADAEAAAGLAMAQLLQRTEGVDLAEAREAAAAANPDDVDAQTLVADLDLLGGHVDDAFDRLVELVRRTSEARARRRPHPPDRALRRRRQRRPPGPARPPRPGLRPVLRPDDPGVDRPRTGVRPRWRRGTMRGMGDRRDAQGARGRCAVRAAVRARPDLRRDGGRALAVIACWPSREAWYVVLVVLTLPLSLLALWVGFYAGLAVGFAVGPTPRSSRGRSRWSGSRCGR